MAGVAYYNTGTATVAVNSKIVTGTGTNWLSVVGGLTAIKAGDKFGIHVGRPIIIASVDSNTQLTLEDNWPGPAQTNAAYKIELTSPDVIAVEALRRVLGSLSGGILYGVSQLTAAPNKALTIDETGAVALADLSPFGKSLIAALNSSAAYGALGVIPNAQLPTRLRDLSTAVTDADTVLANGCYSVLGTAANIPEAQTGMLIVAMYSTTSAGVQHYIRASAVGSPNIWYRVRSGGAWGTWNRIPNFGANNVIPDASLPNRLRDLVSISSDPNTISASGFYGCLGDAPNLPYSGEVFLIEAIVWGDPNYQVQKAWSVFNNTIEYRRTKINNVWQGWLALGDVRGPSAAVTGNSIVGFNGTGGRNVKQLTVSESLAALGPVFGGTPPVPSAAGVGLSDGDFNTLTFGGLFTTTGSYANGPHGNPATHAGVVEVYTRFQTGIVQIYRSFITATLGIAYRRTGTRNSGTDPWTWSTWSTEGDVTGPASASNNRVAIFSGASGKIIYDAGLNLSDIAKFSDVYTRSQTYTQAQTQSLVTTARQVRLGAQGAALTVVDQWTIAPSGSFLTAIKSDGIYATREVAYRAVQQTDVSGNWVTVAQV